MLLACLRSVSALACAHHTGRRSTSTTGFRCVQPWFVSHAVPLYPDRARSPYLLPAARQGVGPRPG